MRASSSDPDWKKVNTDATPKPPQRGFLFGVPPLGGSPGEVTR